MVPSFFMPILATMLKLCRRRQVVNTSSIEYWYFTGLPSRLENSTAQKSAPTESFLVPPKPPPIKGWMTRIFDSGRLKQAARWR
jgi:hypothetical protein